MKQWNPHPDPPPSNKSSSTGEGVAAQSGATLIEVLVALGILASAIVILITGLSTGSFAVRSTDTLTTASNLAAAQLESIKAQPYGASYTQVDAAPGYTITIAQSLVVTGLQQITVTVVFNGGSFKVSNYKVNR
jgi:Tfp pilus assembly protein PilV